MEPGLISDDGSLIANLIGDPEGILTGVWVEFCGGGCAASFASGGVEDDAFSVDNEEPTPTFTGNRVETSMIGTEGSGSFCFFFLRESSRFIRGFIHWMLKMIPAES